MGLGHLLLPSPSPSPSSSGGGGGLLAVADWGRRLSRGERQRVALARALYHEPKASSGFVHPPHPPLFVHPLTLGHHIHICIQLLFLDEATSALDAASEAQLLGRVLAVRRRLTGMAIVATGHGGRLAAYHDRVVDMAADAGGGLV